MTLVDVPRQVKAAGGPGALSLEVDSREPGAVRIIGNLNVIAALPNRPRLQLDDNRGDV
jgi:hypothetical protein